MNTYERPIIVASESLAEGVYMASGSGTSSSGDCLTITVTDAQTWSGSAHVFEVHLTHSTTVTHISSTQTVTLTFSQPLSSNSYAEFPSTVSGNSITITRNLLADAYYSGDSITFKVWAISSTGDQATTEALAITNKSVSCTHSVNVQDGFD